LTEWHIGHYDMKHLVIIPAYNEEDNISRALDSIVNQSSIPTTLVIVDDGSTDQTPSILKAYSEQHPWIKVVTNRNKDPRATGAKIVRAFNLGLNSEDISQYDIISKYDADLVFPENYFENVITTFKQDEKIGLTGGICMIEDDGKWKEESVSKGDHVRGALKSYRRIAFEQMGGLKTFMGWDSADEFILRYHDWKIKRNDALEVKHYRETNQLNGWIKTSRLNAEVFHNLDYGFFIGTTSSLKRGIVYKPYILSGLLTLFYYYKGYLTGNRNKLDPAIGKFIRTYRRKSILK